MCLCVRCVTKGDYVCVRERGHVCVFVCGQSHSILLTDCECVCVYMSVCVCVFVSEYIFMYVHVHVCVCVCPLCVSVHFPFCRLTQSPFISLSGRNLEAATPLHAVAVYVCLSGS